MFLLRPDPIILPLVLAVDAVDADRFRGTGLGTVELVAGREMVRLNSRLHARSPVHSFMEEEKRKKRKLLVFTEFAILSEFV